MQINHALVVYYVHNYHSLEAVKRELDALNIQYTCVRRAFLCSSHLRGKDFVIAVGGDGTLLRAARLVTEQPVLLVSSDVSRNEGFFARADKDDFGEKLRRVLGDEFKILSLTRLQAVINAKKELPPVLNEYFIGSKRPSHTSLYMIVVGAKREHQKSSGVLAYTAAGSYGWAASAGAKPAPLDSEGMRYIVREPYRGRLTRPGLIQGSLAANEKLLIESDIRDGIVVPDSAQQDYSFACGDKIEITTSKYPLKFVSF